MRILVTGANGFLGKQLTKRFQEKGYQTVSPREINPKFDVRNKEHVRQLENQEFDCVLHLAAKTAIDISYSDPELYYEVNVLGTLRMLEFARKKKARFVYPSSAAVYGPQEVMPISETNYAHPRNPYGMSKLLAERLAENYAQSFGVKVVALRLFNTYGSGHNPNFIIPKIIKGVKEGKMVFKYGTSSKRDFVFIKDVLLAFEKAVEFDQFEKVPFEAFNIGTGVSHSIQELFEIVCNEINSNPETEIHETKQKGGVDESRANVQKARDKLKFEAKYSLQDGIREMVA
jgi:nucleoside-diphosphate-sugar epimerase